MKMVKAWEEEGVEIPAPFQRRIKALFAPDKGGVKELLFTHAILPPGGKTDAHAHDRGELIYVVEGEGLCIYDGGRAHITADMALWAEAGETHQIINLGYGRLKLATVFVPPYLAAENYKRCEDAARAIREVKR